MRFNIQNPAFLQAAGNSAKKEFVSFLIKNSGSNKINISGNGKVSVVTTYNGVERKQNLVDPTNETVDVLADNNTSVFVIGEITSISNYVDGFAELSSIDFSNAPSLISIRMGGDNMGNIDVTANTNLEDLNVSNAGSLTSLDLSANTSLKKLFCGYTRLESLDLRSNKNLEELNLQASIDLTSLDMGENTLLNTMLLTSSKITSIDLGNCVSLSDLTLVMNDNLTEIHAIALNQSVASRIASAITSATSVDGTVTLRQGDEFNQTIIDAAMEKGWDVQYAE